MPQNGTFIECWSYASLSVGLVRLFLSLSRGYCFRNANDNNFDQTSCACAATNSFCVGKDGSLKNALSGILGSGCKSSVTSLYDDQLVLAFSKSIGHICFSLTFFVGLMSVGHARLSLTLSRGLFFLRYLNDNKLSGSIPAQISVLVKLSVL